jgi:hypothetical protein
MHPMTMMALTDEVERERRRESQRNALHRSGWSTAGDAATILGPGGPRTNLCGVCGSSPGCGPAFRSLAADFNTYESEEIR